MGSIEKKVIDAILTLIRARRESEADLPAPSAAATGPVTLREARLSDFRAVADLKGRWGLTLDSLENWERLWCENPALGPLAHPIGWVLEADGRLVGYLGNISQLYRYGDKTLNSVSSHGLVVEPAFRGAAMSLVAAFYRQESVDLFLTTTAIEASGKIARAFKSDPLPQADYDTVLFWVLQPYPFSRAVMKKLQVGPVFSRVGAIFASFVIKVDGIRRRKPSGSEAELAVSESCVSDIGNDFRHFWEQKVDEKPHRLLADRSPAALRWHFQIPGDRGTTRVLCCRRNEELIGYAVVRNEAPNEATGLRSSILADMLAKQDDPDVLRALWRAAYDQAVRAESHVLEVLGFPPSVRQVFLPWNPYLRKYPAHPFYYKAADPTMHKTLSDGMAWYANPFDGDTTVISASFSSSVPPHGSSAEQIKTTRNNIVSEVTERVKSKAADCR